MTKKLMWGYTLLLGVFTLSGCGLLTADTRDVLTLRLQQVASVLGTTDRLTFDAVKGDSRCPPSAVCIWEGVAEVRFTYQHGAEKTTFVLASMQNPAAFFHTTYQINGYRFTYVRLTPEYGAKEDASPKVTVQIEKI